MLLYDYHVHTDFSDDSDAPMTDMVEKAVSLGIKKMAITDHYDPGYPDPLFPFVLDEDNRLYRNLNRQMVRMENVDSRTDREELRRIIAEHVRCTGSAKGKEVLEHFAEYVPQFKKIIPSDYKEMLRLIARGEERGMDPERARIEAFHAFVGQGAPESAH